MVEENKQHFGHLKKRLMYNWIANIYAVCKEGNKNEQTCQNIYFLNLSLKMAHDFSIRPKIEIFTFQPFVTTIDKHEIVSYFIECIYWS